MESIPRLLPRSARRGFRTPPEPTAAELEASRPARAKLAAAMVLRDLTPQQARETLGEIEDYIASEEVLGEDAETRRDVELMLPHLRELCAQIAATGPTIP